MCVITLNNNHTKPITDICVSPPPHIDDIFRNLELSMSKVAFIWGTMEKIWWSKWQVGECWFRLPEWFPRIKCDYEFHLMQLCPKLRKISTYMLIYIWVWTLTHSRDEMTIKSRGWRVGWINVNLGETWHPRRKMCKMAT